MMVKSIIFQGLFQFLMGFEEGRDGSLAAVPGCKVGATSDT